MHAIYCIAQKELKDGLRNRWIIAITLIFALLSIGISWFGAAASGVVGFTSIPNTIVSLASLAVFIIPLISLLLSYDAVVGEDEDGTLLLLLTYPISRMQLLLGKLLGHTLILGIATLAGFGMAALTIVLFAEGVDSVKLSIAFMRFILSAVMLGGVFICIAYLISVLVSEKSKAAGLALISWFLFVLVFDFSLLGLLVATKGQLSPEFFPYLLLLNPSDIFRLINLIGFEGSGAGLLVMADEIEFSMTTLFLMLFAWLLFPLLSALWVFKRRTV
ncbi:MAG: ABC transporter permease [Gammaproteobacteria bacterium]|nr:ABC transporter permease [Gammaproteobacteria bacterium]